MRRSPAATLAPARPGLALLAALAALALLGCPDDPPPPPPPPRSTRRVDPTPGAAPEEPDMSQQPSSSDRQRLLAMTPGEVLAGGLRGDGPGGLQPLLAGEGALAMAEQLRAGEVPLEALDLCIVAFDRARERARGATVEDDARAELVRGLRLQAAGHPTLLAWVEALAERVFLREDLPAALAFLVKVREVRAISQAGGRAR